MMSAPREKQESKLKEGKVKAGEGSSFWPEGWRGRAGHSVCKCQNGGASQKNIA